MRQEYSRDQKIEYYTDKIKRLEESIQRQVWYLQKVKTRLEFIKSESYQNWDSDLEKSLKALLK